MYRMHDNTSFGTTFLSSYTSSNASLVLSTSICSTTTAKVLPRNHTTIKRVNPTKLNRSSTTRLWNVISANLMLKPVQSCSTDAKMLLKVFDDSWGSEDNGHYARTRRSLDSIYKIVLQLGHEAATGKSLIWLKTDPFSKNMLYRFLFILLSLTASFLLSLFQKVKSSQNCAMSLQCIQNISFQHSTNS